MHAARLGRGPHGPGRGAGQAGRRRGRLRQLRRQGDQDQQARARRARRHARLRTVGVVEEDPERGLAKIAKPVGVVAALSRPPARTPRRRSRPCSRSRAATRSWSHPPAHNRTTAAVVEYMREACEQVGAGRSRAGARRAVDRQDPGADAPGRPHRGHGRRRHGQGRVQRRVPRRTASVSATPCTLSTRRLTWTTPPPPSPLRRRSTTPPAAWPTTPWSPRRGVYDGLLDRLVAGGGHLCSRRGEGRSCSGRCGRTAAHPLAGRDRQARRTIAELAGFTIPDDRTFLIVEEDGIGPDHPFSARSCRWSWRPTGTTVASTARSIWSTPSRLPGPGPHLRHPHAERRARRGAGRGHQDGARPGQPEPQRGRRKPAQRPAVHPQPELRHLGRQHHHRERERTPLRQPDLGVPADPPTARSARRTCSRPLGAPRPLTGVASGTAGLRRGRPGSGRGQLQVEVRVRVGRGRGRRSPGSAAGGTSACCGGPTAQRRWRRSCRRTRGTD